MARPYNILTALSIKKHRKEPGRHSDGRCLHLYVQRNGTASWIFRYRDRLTGKLRDKGLGSLDDVSLEQARLRASECRALLTQGKDPIEVAHESRRARKSELASRLTFRECFEQHFSARKSGWKNEKHRAQWVSTVNTYCKDLLDLPIESVDTTAVTATLLPIWMSKPETARRVRQRIEAVVDWAKATGRYTGENPARLKGHLDKLLPKKKKDVNHRPAVPYGEAPAFMASLAKHSSASAKALLLQRMTASRPNEAVSADWKEFDRGQALWVIPTERMKAGREHTVPLPTQLVAVLSETPEKFRSGLLFPGKGDKPMTTAAVLKLVKQLYPGNPKITAHGFRSTFRDWAGAVSNHPTDVAEAALAHVISNKTEAAYARDSLLQKRRLLMQDWANYCFSQQPES